MFIYIANLDIFGKSASRLQVLQMYKCFSKFYPKNLLLIPIRQGYNHNDYNKLNFARALFSIDFLGKTQIFPKFGILFYSLQNISFSLSTLVSVLKIKSTSKIIYSRSKLAGFLCSLFYTKVIFEAHDSAKNHIFNKLVSKYFYKVVCISKTVENSWQKLGAKTMYAPDGVDPIFFNKMDKTAIRKKLNIANSDKVIIYTGSFYPWKGVETLVSAVKNLNVKLFLLGDTTKASKVLIDMASKSKNINLIGHQEHSDIPKWLVLADILAIPNSGKYQHSREDTSPLKLFEYMASGVPIIASKVLSLKEIVNENMVTFFDPDESEDLSKKIKWMLEHTDVVNKKAVLAKMEAEKYTWDQRAKKIIEEIK